MDPTVGGVAPAVDMTAGPSGTTSGPAPALAATPRLGDWFLPFWPIADDRLDTLLTLRPLDPIARVAAAPAGSELLAYDDEHGMRDPQVRADRLAFLRRALCLSAPEDAAAR